MSLYVCAWAAEFPAQALLRLRTDWQTEPVVVLDGRAPEEWVCSLNRLAERRGAAAGMTRLEAESMTGVRLLKRSAESEAAARAVMLECVAKFSPRIEEVCGACSGAKAPNHSGESDVRAKARTLQAKANTLQNALHATGVSRADCCDESSGTACAFVLDIAGTERLFGPPAQLAERLREELAGAGFRAAVAVSANFDTARMKAASMRVRKCGSGDPHDSRSGDRRYKEAKGTAVIAEGAEAEALARLPIAALNLDEEYATTFALWGIGTLGELAALPEAELVARMGPKAGAWRTLGRGEAEHTFEPIEAEFALEEFCEFETPVEQIDSLLFVGARMIDCLATRAAGRALALRSLTAEMGLEGGKAHGCAIRPAVPTIDKKFLLKLLQLEIGTHPPQAAVVRLTLRAEAGAQSKVQMGLFAPQTPEPSRLDVTLARLRAMVGEERVGSPVLDDTHRADGFRMEWFVNPGPQMPGIGGTHESQQVSRSASRQVSETGDDGRSRMALRRVRPARVLRVVVLPTLAAKDALRLASHPSDKNKGVARVGHPTMKPVAFSDGENRYEIAAAYGPWRTSGCWWELSAWDAEEWDVLAVRVENLPSGAKAPINLADPAARLKPCPFKASASSPFKAFDPRAGFDCSGGATIACLLTRDRARNAWRLEAFYD